MIPALEEVAAKDPAPEVEGHSSGICCRSHRGNSEARIAAIEVSAVSSHYTHDRVRPVWVLTERANELLRNGRSLRSYNDLAGRTERALRGRNHAKGYPGGLIKTMNGGVRTRSCAAQPPSDRKTPCLEIPARRAEYLLTENVASPFQANQDTTCPEKSTFKFSSGVPCSW